MKLPKPLLMRSEVLNKVRDHGESWRVTEEQVVGERSRNLQPDGFGRPNPQVSVEQFVQRLSVAASDRIAWALNITYWFPLFILDDF